LYALKKEKDFPQVYDKDFLEELIREFSFKPTEIRNPKILSKKDIQSFDENGFLSGIQLFNDDAIKDIRNYFDTLLENALNAGDDSYSISTAHLKHKKVYDLLLNKRIIKIVSDLLGENIIGWGSHFFCKLPEDHKKISWHQDASYWPFSKTNTVSCWLAIDDAIIENGCLEFIPGSHRFGLINYEMSKKEENNILNQTVHAIEKYGDPIPIELNAGQISIHSDLLLHSSKPNTSKNRRCGLSLRYCTPDIKPYAGWNAKGVLIKGSDPQNNWLNPPPPIS
jgi:ectoine hydroxylase-related dioxygenase (phytanoyl-CoA dioxygenase family)